MPAPSRLSSSFSLSLRIRILPPHTPTTVHPCLRESAGSSLDTCTTLHSSPESPVFLLSSFSSSYFIVLFPPLRFSLSCNLIDNPDLAFFTSRIVIAKMARSYRPGGDKTTQILRSLHVAGEGSGISYASQAVPISPSRDRAKMDGLGLSYSLHIFFSIQ